MKNAVRNWEQLRRCQKNLLLRRNVLYGFIFKLDTLCVCNNTAWNIELYLIVLQLRLQINQGHCIIRQSGLFYSQCSNLRCSKKVVRLWMLVYLTNLKLYFAHVKFSRFLSFMKTICLSTAATYLLHIQIIIFTNIIHAPSPK